MTFLGWLAGRDARPVSALLAAIAVGCNGQVITQQTACGPENSASCGTGGGGIGGGGNTGTGGGDGKAHVARRFGDADRQFAMNVAVDSSGNILLTGYSNGLIDFGSGVFGGSGFRDVFFAKLDPGLNHLHSKVFGDGSGSGQRGFELIEDGHGNLLATGEFTGTIDFGGGPLPGNGDLDLFVARFDSTLGHLQSRRFGGAMQTGGRGIAADSAGNVIVVGYFSGDVDLGGGLFQSADLEDAFVAKYDAQLGHLYSKRFGGAGRQQAYDVAVDSADNLVVGGFFDGTIDLGGGPLTSAGDQDVFVAKFGPNLEHLWSRSFGDADPQILWRLALDKADDVLIAGYFKGDVDFGGGALTAEGEVDAFVAKLDSKLQHIASRRFGGPEAQSAYGLAVDTSGNVLVAGGFSGSMDVGGVPLVSAGGQDIFVAKLDPQLQPIWARRFGGAEDQEASAVAVDAKGHVVLAGGIWGSVDFGEGPLTSAGDSDVFVATLPP